MLTPTVEIRIGNLLFHGLNEFKISRSVEDLSATGKLSLPRLAVYDNKKRSVLAVSTQIKVKDPVTIDAGYMEDRLYTVFKGYVKAINPGERVVIDVEDVMFLLRLKPVVMTRKKIKLKKLLADLLEGTSISVSARSADMLVDEFQYNGNVAGAIAKIKDQLKLTVYINENNVLYAGGESLEMLPAEERSAATINLTYGRNIISNNVEYQTAESKPIQIVVKGKSKNGKETVVMAGMDGGDKQTYMRYNVTDKATLQKIADEYYSQQSYDGFRGTLTLFGIPRAIVGGTVNYKNENYEDVEGRYFIKAADVSMDSGGLRQTVTLGYKI